MDFRDTAQKQSILPKGGTLEMKVQKWALTPAPASGHLPLRGHPYSIGSALPDQTPAWECCCHKDVGVRLLVNTEPPVFSYLCPTYLCPPLSSSQRPAAFILESRKTNSLIPFPHSRSRHSSIQQKFIEPLLFALGARDILRNKTGY